MQQQQPAGKRRVTGRRLQIRRRRLPQKNRSKRCSAHLTTLSLRTRKVHNNNDTRKKMSLSLSLSLSIFGFVRVCVCVCVCFWCQVLVRNYRNCCRRIKLCSGANWRRLLARRWLTTITPINTRLWHVHHHQHSSSRERERERGKNPTTRVNIEKENYVERKKNSKGQLQPIKTAPAPQTAA